jgi:hypothetical protein
MLTHRDRKKTDNDLYARDPHETFVGASCDEPVVGAPC